MEKEQNQNNTDNSKENNEEKDSASNKINQNLDKENKLENKLEEKIKEKSLEERNLELEDKLARTFAEMENQRRRFEKEKEEAFEYGGFTFAREALNLIDNLDRSKQILTADETLNGNIVLSLAKKKFAKIFKTAKAGMP